MVSTRWTVADPTASGGQKRAVRWIAGGFAAGARRTRSRAGRASWLSVLESLAGGNDFVAKLGRTKAFGGYKFTRMCEPWPQARLVMDPATRRPITSDYDLAAVVDTASRITASPMRRQPESRGS